MLEPILESNRERRLERALLVIEGLCHLDDDNMNQVDSLMNRIYLIAHNATGRCQGCGTTHLGAIEKEEVILKEANIIDSERVLSRPLEEGMPDAP